MQKRELTSFRHSMTHVPVHIVRLDIGCLGFWYLLPYKNRQQAVWRLELCLLSYDSGYNESRVVSVVGISGNLLYLLY